MIHTTGVPAGFSLKKLKAFAGIFPTDRLESSQQTEPRFFGHLLCLAPLQRQEKAKQTAGGLTSSYGSQKSIFSTNKFNGNPENKNFYSPILRVTKACCKTYKLSK
jgi:hypothetical protein